MDGTLINSGNVIANTINYVRLHFNLKPLDKTHILACVNNPKLNSASFFYECETFTSKHSQLFEEYYDKHCISDIELYDGIKELLQTLKDDFILTIATNASATFALQMTKHLKIEHYFQDIVGADMVKQSKPNPDMINLLIKKHNFNLKNTILVGDSHKDVLSAKSANINSILVNWGFSNHQDGDALNNVEDLRKRLLEWKNV